jgi:hypothetical protein
LLLFGAICFGFICFERVLSALTFFFAFLFFKALDLAFAWDIISAKTLASAPQSEIKKAITNINIIFFIKII